MPSWLFVQQLFRAQTNDRSRARCELGRRFFSVLAHGRLAAFLPEVSLVLQARQSADLLQRRQVCVNRG